MRPRHEKWSLHIVWFNQSSRYFCICANHMSISRQLLCLISVCSILWAVYPYYYYYCSVVWRVTKTKQHYYYRYRKITKCANSIPSRFSEYEKVNSVECRSCWPLDSNFISCASTFFLLIIIQSANIIVNFNMFDFNWRYRCESSLFSLFRQAMLFAWNLIQILCTGQGYSQY